MSNTKTVFLYLVLLFTPTMLVLVGKLVTGGGSTKAARRDLGHGVGEKAMEVLGRDSDAERETRRQAARVRAQAALDKVRAYVEASAADDEELRREFAAVEGIVRVAGEVGDLGDKVSGKEGKCPLCGHPFTAAEAEPAATAPVDKAPSSTSRPR